jgi:formylglycine-generating enzyme required for sulfatase activity
VKDSTSIAELEVVAKRYAPSGSVYADLARARIEELRKKQRADEERPGRVFRDCAHVCPEMVVIPAGSFLMGSTAAEIEALVTSVPANSIVRDVRIKWYRSEGPQRRVTFAKPFAVGKFEVTFAEWEACVAAGGCTYNPGDRGCRPVGSVGSPLGLAPALGGCEPGDQGWGRGRRPVLDVSWNDIVTEYLPWLSRKTGKAYRLLTEAEWEYAARAGTATRYAFGDTITRSLARYLPDGGGWKTAEVGSFPANAFGLHDMHGNLGEWVQDCESDSYDGAPTDGSARITGACNFRVIRGGSIWADPLGLRPASRSRARPDHRGQDQGVRIMFNGFRVARAF